jgi:hypothetical protein
MYPDRADDPGLRRDETRQVFGRKIEGCLKVAEMSKSEETSFRPTKGQLLALGGFAFAAVAFVGFAVDTNNIHAARTNLQKAVETAAIRLPPEFEKKSDDELKVALQKMIEKQVFVNDDPRDLTVAVDRKKHRLSVNATMRVESTITSLIGPDHVDVSAAAETASN